MVQQQYAFRRNHIEFESGSFPRLAIYGRTLSHDGGKWQPQLPVSHTFTRVNNQYTFNHSVPIAILCFTFRRVLNKLHEIFDTLL